MFKKMGPEGSHETNAEAFKMQYKSCLRNCTQTPGIEEAGRVSKKGPEGPHETNAEATSLVPSLI